MLKTDQSLPWPPPYKLKKHSKARSVKLKISRKHGLEIVTPNRFSLKHIPHILEEHRSWIIKELSVLPPTDQLILPHHLSLAAVQKEYKIIYMPCERKLSLIARPNQEIVLFGRVAEEDKCQKLLQLFVREQAKYYLPLLLEQLSQQLQLPYRDVQVRSQTARWGSCSVSHEVRLNDKLIFLPPALTQHVMIHELCHTQFFNHSAEFWQLVASFDAKWREHKRQLRRAGEYIPGWVTW